MSNRKIEVLLVTLFTASLILGALSLNESTDVVTFHHYVRDGGPVLTVPVPRVHKIEGAGVPTTLAPSLPPGVMARWIRVHRCEQPSTWHDNGPIYGGGLGISRRSWAGYGGLRDFGDEANATPTQQVIVARRIEGTSYVPDQAGCSGSW
jgi:hypothetical protein